MRTTPLEASKKLAEDVGIKVHIANPESRSRFEPATTARALLDDGLRVAKGGGQLYAYDSGTYRLAREVLLHYLTEFLASDWSPTRADAVMRFLYDSASILWETPPADQINVRNGILDLNSGVLLPHGSDFLSPVQLNVDFDPDAECPAVRKFISEVFPTDVQRLAYELAGLLCVADISWQTVVMLVGLGANGKSTYLSLLNTLLLPQNVSHESLQALSTDRFSTAELYGRLANICADLSPQRIETSSTLKAITGGDRVRAERKYGQPFSFIPFARLLFSANEIPGSADSSYAYRRRWIVVPFPNRFEGDTADRHLLEKLTTPTELSGFFNHAMAAYAQAQARGALTSGESTIEGAREFHEAIDPIVTFVRERLTISPNARADRAVLYQAYRDWASSVGRGTMSRQKMNRRLVEHLPQLETRAVNGRQTWVGVGLFQDTSLIKG